MDANDAVTVAKKKLQIPTEQNDYEGKTIVKYNGELLELEISENHFEEKNKAKFVVTHISTKSPLFKTKSGMGVGNTRTEIVETYINMQSFEMYPDWSSVEDNGKPKLGDCFFVLNDLDANTNISFKFRNNIVVEVIVSIVNEGC